MSLLNEFNDHGQISQKDLETYLVLLNPVAPHISEEMWELIGLKGYLHDTQWPVYDEDKTQDKVIEIPVQVNGKVRGTITIDAEANKDEVIKKAKEDENIIKFLDGKTIIKEIFVPGKIFNIVVK